MSSIRTIDKAAIEFALEKVENLIDASNGDDSRCVVFRDGPGYCGPFTDEQRRAVRLYVETWIAEPLRAAHLGISGDRSYANDYALRGYAR